MATEKRRAGAVGARASEKERKMMADGYGKCCLCGQEKVRIIVHGKSGYLCRGCVIHVAKSLREMVRSDLLSAQEISGEDVVAGSGLSLVIEIP